MIHALDQLRAERLRQERRTRRRMRLASAGVLGIALALGLLFANVKLGAHRAAATPRSNEQPVTTKTARSPAPARDADTQQTLQDATGLAASLLASTRDTEVARSALVAAQEVTGCAPKEGGPALVHLDDPMERAAELASRTDFFATARDNGREYATHAHAYLGRWTIVYVAVAWECSSGS